MEIPLKSCMRVFSGATVTKTLDLAGYRRQIADGTGKPIKIDSTDSAGGGKITVSLKLCSSSVSHSGPIMKQAASVIGFMKRAGDGGFKRRFMLLTAQSLMYFDDVFTLDAPRNTLLQSDIEAISEENNTLNIVAHNSKESWTMAWVEGEAAAQKKAWLQKLHRFGDRSHAQTGISKAASTVKKSKRRSVFGL